MKVRAQQSKVLNQHDVQDDRSRKQISEQNRRLREAKLKFKQEKEQ